MKQLITTRSSAVADGQRDVRVIWKCSNVVFRHMSHRRRIRHLIYLAVACTACEIFAFKLYCDDWRYRLYAECR